MKIAFAGTPAFAATALRAILEAGFFVPLVLTQPDRPAGRGMRLQSSPVKNLALEHGLRVDQPERLRTDLQQASLRAAVPDVLVVAAYGLILPQAVLDIPRLGCLNIHASLLPRWRGAAPIQRAIEAGDSETGITIMQMDAGLDTGAMLLKESLPITSEDNATSLHDKLSMLGAGMIVNVLHALNNKPLLAEPQSSEGATYAQKIQKAEARIDWRTSADEISRKMRAFDPFPGAVSLWHDEPIKMFRGLVEPSVTAPPGQVVEVSGKGVKIACGDGALRVTCLQRPGGKRLEASQSAYSWPFQLGDRFS